MSGAWADAVASCVRQPRQYALAMQAVSLLTRPVFASYSMVSLAKVLSLIRRRSAVSMELVERYERGGHGLRQCRVFKSRRGRVRRWTRSCFR